MKLCSGFKHWSRPYLFREMEDIIRRMPLEQKRELISLGIGDPDLPTPRGIREAIRREHATKYYGYPSIEGRLDLREAISAYYHSRFHVSLDPDQIMVGMGAKTDLFDLPGVFADPGDQVAIMDPVYPVYRDATEYRNQEVLYLIGNQANDYLPKFHESRIRKGKLALIFLCYPNNPTGAMATPAYIASMIESAHQHSALIVFDVAYADFIPGNKVSGAFSIFSIPGADEVGIEIGSFSKPYSMTGDRLSWVAIKNPAVLSAWKRYRSNRDSGASSYDQAGALAALTDSTVAQDVRENMRVYGERAGLMKSTFQQAGITITSLENSPYCWFPSPISDSQEAARQILARTMVLVTPGAGFGGSGEGFLRATLFQPHDRLKTALDRIFHAGFTWGSGMR